MSDYGFVDEAPEPTPRGGGTPSGGRAPRRSHLLGVAFAVVLVGLLAFVGWAWATRAHSDDLAAYDALRSEISVMDRRLVPQRHSEIPPCRDGQDATITRTYPPSSGPAPDEIGGYLQQTGWSEVAATPPVVVALVKTVDGHQQTVSIVATTRSSLALSLSATSSAGTVGCLLR